MLSKKQQQFVNSLKQKKNREALHLFIAEGTKVVTELLNSSIVVKQLFATSHFLEKKTISAKTECIEIKASELERISLLTSPNEVLAICETPRYNLVTSQLNSKLTFVLDDIKDPGNLGTIIRIADWFGVEHVICSAETVEAYNPKVVQATMGSIARVKIHKLDLIEFFKTESPTLKIESFGAVLNGENIYSKTLPENGLLVIGNESRGISENLLPYITNKIGIPSFSSFKPANETAESLNAAIATAIICSEFRRRIK
jgi:TrmH family RNA methyltransferase